MTYCIIHWFSLLCIFLLFTTVQVEYAKMLPEFKDSSITISEHTRDSACQTPPNTSYDKSNSYTFQLTSQVSHVPAEKGQSATLECKLPTARSVTWKVLNGSQGDVELSSCNATSGVCVDKQPQQYKGNITSSSGGYTSTLVISRANTAETQFTCWTDNNSVVANISLEVYVLPATPNCTRLWTLSTYSYIDVTCDTANVYPHFHATLHRRELDDIIFDTNATFCGGWNDGAGTGSGSCTWRIPLSSLLEINTFYVEMVTVVWNKTHVGRSVFSPNISATISLPSVIIYGRNCPVGDGVIGEYIKKGTQATCQCDLVSSGLVSGRVRWYTHDGDLVKNQIASFQSSVLSFSYNASDTNQTYDCRADNPTLTYYHLVYTPKFASSPPQSLISGLLFVMGIILALKLA